MLARSPSRWERGLWNGSTVPDLVSVPNVYGDGEHEYKACRGAESTTCRDRDEADR